MTKAPERWDASWSNNVAAARIDDDQRRRHFPHRRKPRPRRLDLQRMSDAGLDGMAVGLVNFLDLPFVRDEILPRMVRLGLRQAST